MENKQTSKPFVIEKPPANWQELMSRSQKSFRNKWNTFITPHEKTPKAVKKEKK